MKKYLLLVAAMSAVVANISAQEAAIVLYENFSSADAFPAGWEVVNSTAEMAVLKDGVFSWRVASAPDDFPKPIDGDKVALIYQASYTDGDGKRVELSQDEWLVTPSIELGADPQLTFGLSYVPMFLYNCSNEYLDLPPILSISVNGCRRQRSRLWSDPTVPTTGTRSMTCLTSGRDIRSTSL